MSLNDISVFAMRWRPCANPHFSGDGGTDDDAKTEPAPLGATTTGAAGAASLMKPVPVARLEARREMMLFKRSSCAALRTQLRYAVLCNEHSCSPPKAISIFGSVYSKIARGVWS